MGRHHFGRIARACAATAVAVATLVGVGGAPAGAVGGSIDGSVTRTGGVTLPAGTVEVVACNASSGLWSANCGGPSATVAADGSYSVPVADGNWIVGVANVQGKAIGATTTVPVSGGPTVQNFEVQAAVVTGRVQHPSGVAYPVGHAALVLCPTSGNGNPGSQALFCSFVGGVNALTDAAGDVTVALPQGQWYAIGAVTSAVIVPNSSAPSLPSTITDLGVLTDGATASVTANVAASFVNGHVTDAATSATLPNVTVTFCTEPVTAGCTIAASVTTAADGSYSAVLPPGSYTGAANGQGGVQAVQGGIVTSDAVDQMVDFAIGGGSISGSFQDPVGGAYPVANPLLSLCNTTKCISVSLNSPFPGSSTFTIHNVAPGDYDVFLGQFGTSTMAHLVGAPVTVVEGQDSAGEIVRVGGGSIAATVTNNGAPVQFASVRGCLQTSFAPSGEICSGSPFTGTDGAGHVTLTGLPAGTYTVRAASGSLSGSASGIVVADATTAPATIALLQSGMSGTVTGDTGSLAAVVACPGTTDPPVVWANPPSAPCLGGQVALISGGTYSFASLSPGPYRVRAYAQVNNVQVRSDAVAATVTSGIAIVNLALPGGNSGSVPTGGGSVNLQSPAGTTLSGITASAVPASPAPPAAAQAFPVGVLSFSVTLPVGQTTADVVLQLPPGSGPNAYYKLRNGSWVDFTANTTIVGDTVTLHLVDNDSFDTNPAVGVIGDPGAPVVADRTGPVVECPAAPTFLLHQTGTSLTANLSDAGSGVASPTVTVAADTDTVGARTVDVTATDLAGNSTTKSCNYAVAYNFTGFKAPVDNALVNSAKAGQAVPVKWTTTGASGEAVADPASVVSVRSSGAACSSGATDELEAYASGASGLQYLGSGNWQFTWKTDKAWAGQCRTLTVKLADGTSHTAQFKFK